MTTKRRPPRSRARAPRRAVEWFDTIVDLASGINTQDTLQLSQGIVADERKGMTLVRTIISLDLVAITAGTGTLVSMGIVMMPLEAVLAGAFPDPNISSDNPGWIWRWHRGVFTSVVNDRSQVVHVAHDTPAMRKFPTQDYQVRFILNTAAGASTINTDGLIRTLYKKS